MLCCKFGITLLYGISAVVLQNKTVLTISFWNSLLTVGLQSGESIAWAEALQSEHILCQILWIAENTLNLQLLEKVINTRY